MRFVPKGKRGRIILAVGSGLLLLAVGAALLLNPVLTHYVEGEAFRKGLEMETAKGLHFEEGRYAAIRRTGFFTAATDSFEGTHGRKAMVSMSAHDVTAQFNPWGIFLRRWQLDDVHIRSGAIEIHTYEPKPEPVAQKPWYAAFLPDRVYLKQVVCDTADVTWQLRGEKSGFFGTRLLITPYGRDFEYRASGGMMKMPITPDLHLKETHLLITKQLLTLYNLDLSTDEKGGGSIHLEGKAGLKEDKSVDAEMTFAGVEAAAWVPEAWKGHFSGIAWGDVHWSGKNTKVETSSGHGELKLEHARVSDLPFFKKLVSLTGKQDLDTLSLEECACKLEWNYPGIALKDIAIEERGKFRIEGALSVDRHALGGELRLGVAPEYLAWLPDAGKVFTHRAGNYEWVTIHFSGTVEKPQQDLSPRIMTMLEEHPGALLEFLFKQAGDNLGKLFGGE